MGLRTNRLNIIHLHHKRECVMKHMPRQNTWIHLRIALLLVATALPGAYAQTPGTLTLSAHPQQMSCELMTESVERSAGFLAAGDSLSEAYQHITGQNASLREQVSNILHVSMASELAQHNSARWKEAMEIMCQRQYPENLMQTVNGICDKVSGLASVATTARDNGPISEQQFIATIRSSIRQDGGDTEITQFAIAQTERIVIDLVKYVYQNPDKSGDELIQEFRASCYYDDGNR